MSAVTSGVAELKRILDEARALRDVQQRGTILFIDEIHRFNKAQQDALLHGVEDGTLTLIGATTENPSFELNAALLSRTQVLVLRPLDAAALGAVLERALTDRERGLGEPRLEPTPEARDALLALAAGDARALLNFLELSALLARSRRTRRIDEPLVREAAGRRAIRYDKAGEEHYNIVSAFIKSMRGSDPDAALYWLARMIEGGEDPLFIARRMVIFASEDVGNADPRALQVAVAARDAVHFVGMPEGFYPLSQCAVFLATAPKSNASGAGYARALEAVRRHGPLPVPLHLRNAPTEFTKRLGYGKGYRSPHDREEDGVDERYLPVELEGRRFYRPTDRGDERRIGRRLETWRSRRPVEGSGDGG